LLIDTPSIRPSRRKTQQQRQARAPASTPRPHRRSGGISTRSSTPSTSRRFGRTPAFPIPATYLYRRVPRPNSAKWFGLPACPKPRRAGYEPGRFSFKRSRGAAAARGPARGDGRPSRSRCTFFFCPDVLRSTLATPARAKRYKPAETLEGPVSRGKSIRRRARHDRRGKAAEFFKAVPRAFRRKTFKGPLHRVGLGLYPCRPSKRRRRCPAAKPKARQIWQRNCQKKRAPPARTLHLTILDREPTHGAFHFPRDRPPNCSKCCTNWCRRGKYSCS